MGVEKIPLENKPDLFTEPLKEEVKTEENPKTKSVLERLYKSKLARTLAFAGLLGIGGVLVEKSSFKSQQEQTKYELVENRDISLGEELENHFLIKKEIEGNNPRIIHIGQIHGADSLKETKEVIDEAKLITQQKDIEKLILYLRDTYNLRQYYVEGIAPDFIEVLQGVKTEIAVARDVEGNLTRDGLYKLGSMFWKISKMENELSERYRAYLMYAIKEAVQTEFERIEKSYNSKEMLTELEKFLSHMKAEELITGDSMYIWGSPMKLYLEGKIDILPAETIEANTKAFAPFKNDEDQKNLEARHLIREKEAVALIMQKVGRKETMVPLIYGKGHNFSNAVQDINKKIIFPTGLVKIESR